MTFSARQAALLGPPPVPIHDTGDVVGNAVRVEIGGKHTPETTESLPSAGGG